MVASPYTKGERTMFKELVVLALQCGIPPTRACEQLNIRYSDLMNWGRSDPAWKQAYDDAMVCCTQVHADKLLTVHEDIPDPKKAKVASENLKWWLARRNVGEFGDRVTVQNEQPALIGILQSAVNRLIDHVAAQQGPLPMKVIEGEAQRVVTRKRFNDSDPDEIASSHLP